TGCALRVLLSLRMVITLVVAHPCLINDVFPIRGVSVMRTFCNLTEGFLFLRDRSPFEDAVVTTADSFCLISGKVSVLRHFHIVRVQVSGNALHDGIHFIGRDVYGTLRSDVAPTVTDEDRP